MTAFKAPADLFQRIEKKILASPWRLKLEHWHERQNVEATEASDILASDCAHCLVGWVIAETPGAAQAEARREKSGCDPLTFANDILTDAGRHPIPAMMPFEDSEVRIIKFIRGRAAEERCAAQQATWSSN